MAIVRPFPAGVMRPGPLAALLLATATAAFLVLAALRNPHVGFFADDALYLLMAEAYSPWREAGGAVYEHLWRYSHLPPFYPLLLGVTGAGPDHLPPARIFTALAMASAWLLCFQWLRRGGVSRPAALLFAVFGAWTPMTLFHAVDLLSEGLYTALVLGCLIGLQTRAARGFVVLLGLGVLAGCACGTRSIGLVLLPAGCVALRRGGWRAVLAFGAGFALITCALWPLDMGAAAPSYLGLLRAHYAPDPGGALTQQLATVAERFPAAALHDLFLWRDASGWRGWAAAALAAVALVGLLRELREGAPAGVYAVGYLLIAVTWPYPEHFERLLYPLLPCSLWFAWRGVAGRESRRQVAGTALAALLCALAAPAVYATLVRAATPLPDPRLDGFRTTRYWLDATRGGDPLPPIRARAAQAVAAADAGRRVPADECIYTVNVQQVMLLARRPTFLPPRPEAMDRGPPWGCAYFLLVGTPRSGRPAFYPLGRLRKVARGLAVYPLDERVPDSPPVAMLMRVGGRAPP